jgi:TolB-like protein
MKRLAIAAVTLMLGSAAYAAGPAKVLLLPFEPAGPAEKQWIAKAIQQNLVAELSRVNTVQPVTGDQTAGTLDAAVKAAADAGADYVVFGSYQAVEGDLRVTGQVVDLSTKQIVSGLKSTGTLRDLFGIEDVIANQVKRSLPQPVAVAQPEMLKQPPAAPPAAVEVERPAVQVNQRAAELEAQIDRAMDRLRYAPYYGDDYGYNFSGIYTSYYPVYYYPVYPRRHHWGHSGHWLSGSFGGGNVSGNFQVGGGSSFVNHNPPADGNYNNFGRMTMQTAGAPAPRR